MHDVPRQKLIALIKRHGTFLSKDAKRCESLLRDACGDEYKREVFVLVYAIKEGIPKDLLNRSPSLSLDDVFARLVQRLHENLGLDKTLAEWVVQTWGIVLEVKATSPVSAAEQSNHSSITQSLTKLGPSALKVVSQLKSKMSQPVTQSQPQTEPAISLPKQLERASLPQMPKVTSQPQRLVSKPVATSPSPTVNPIKPLSPLNPIDHIRLLWWVLVTPQQLQAYRQVFSEADEKRVGQWLVSTLTWWPLLVPTLASGIRLSPYSANTSPAVYLGLSALLLGCWLLTAALRINERANMAIGFALSVGFIVAVGIAFLIADVVGNVEVFVVVFAVTQMVALIVADRVVGGVESGVVLVVMSGVVGGIAGGAAGGVAGLISGGEALVVAVIVLGIVGDAVENSLDNGTTSWLARIAFLLLVAAHLFLMGLYFFNWFKL